MIHLIGSGCDQNSHPYYSTLLPFLKLIKKWDVKFLRNSKGEVLKVHKIPIHFLNFLEFKFVKIK
jgi:DNA phosphorothioation-dependent restriction protein DptG